MMFPCLLLVVFTSLFEDLFHVLSSVMVCSGSGDVD